MVVLRKSSHVVEFVSGAVNHICTYPGVPSDLLAQNPQNNKLKQVSPFTLYQPLVPGCWQFAMEAGGSGVKHSDFQIFKMSEFQTFKSPANKAYTTFQNFKILKFEMFTFFKFTFA